MFTLLRTKNVLLVICVSLLLLCGFDSIHRPETKGRKYYEERGEIVWEVPMSQKMIALTFDDGPDVTETPAILDLLKQHNAKATFFLIGERVEKFPELVMRELQEGHELANHTYSHPYFRDHTTQQQVSNEINKAEEAIYNLTGVTTSLFRPPGGLYNDDIVQTVNQENYTVIMWSWHQETRDWARPGVNKIINKVLNNARSGDIVLFHDHVDGPSQTIDALKVILPELQKRGFQFVTVSELLKHNKYRPVSDQE